MRPVIRISSNVWACVAKLSDLVFEIEPRPFGARFCFEWTAKLWNPDKMRHTYFKPLVTLTLLIWAQAAVGQEADCRADDYLQAAIAHLESHYRSFPEELFTAQLYLKEGFSEDQIEPDGKWGPKTERAICGALVKYTEIGGSDGDWGIHRSSHGPNFSLWLLRAARANLSDGEVEFPD